MVAGYWKKLDKSLIQEFFSEAAVKAGIPEITAKQSRKKVKLLDQLISDGMVIQVDDEKRTGKVLINLKNDKYCHRNGWWENKL